MSEQTPKQPATTPPVQPPVEKDLEERIDGFNGELRPLLGKYELGLSALAKILPNGLVAADPIIVSMRGKEAPKEAPKEEPVAPKLENPEA